MHRIDNLTSLCMHLKNDNLIFEAVNEKNFIHTT